MVYKVFLTATSYNYDTVSGASGKTTAEQRFIAKDWDSLANLLGSLVETTDEELNLKIRKEEGDE